MKRPIAYAPHLVLRGHSVAPETEWRPRLAGLTVILVRAGAGYFLQPKLKRELPAGTVLMAGPLAEGTLRASRLAELRLAWFHVIPERLNGLLSFTEQHALETALNHPESGLRLFTPQDPLAARVAALAAEGPTGLAARLEMLQIMAAAFDLQPVRDPGQPAISMTSDAGQRLELVLQQTPVSVLMEMKFSDLAQMTHCTARHLSRLFQRLVGMSFNDKRSELRLARALELLADSHLKVVDVALESGFKSLSQFNQVFARQFGLSPGRWRDKNGGASAAVPLKKPATPKTSREQKLVIQVNPARPRVAHQPAGGFTAPAAV